MNSLCKLASEGSDTLTTSAAPLRMRSSFAVLTSLLGHLIDDPAGGAYQPGHGLNNDTPYFIRRTPYST